MRIPGSATTASLAAVLLLASCTTDTSTNPAPDLPASATTTATNTPETTSPRGHHLKQLGDTAAIGPAVDAPDTTVWSIDSITVDPDCTRHGTPPESGHTLLLHVRVATGTERQWAQMAPAAFNHRAFAEIDADGVTRRAQHGQCTSYDNRLPGDFGVNQRYRGTVELVVPEANGVLVQTMQGLADGRGWEWRY